MMRSLRHKVKKVLYRKWQEKGQDSWEKYKESTQCAKKTTCLSLAKENKRREIASDLNNSENQNKTFRIAKQMVKERQDVTGSVA